MTAGTALDTAALDKALNDLHFSAPDWAALSLAEKVAMLEALPRKVLDLAPQMVAAAADAKGIAPTSTWTAEEWSVGVWVFIQAVNTQLLVLKRILAGREPIDGNAVHTRPDGQVVVDVFPLTGYDRLFLNGYRAAVWLEPNVSAEAFFPTEPFASLRARSGGDWGRFEQLADFRNLRPFRNAIFARGGAPDPRREAARLRGLWASADLRIENADPNAPEGALFVSSGGAKLRTNNPALAGLLTRLSETFPLALPLDAALELDALADHLYQLFVTHVVRLATVPQPFVDRPGDRPKANALARVQAGRGEMQLATLRHAMIRIDEPRMLAFVPLIDGSRTRVELVQEFARLFAIAQNEAEWRLDESLAELGRRGLMVE